MASTPAHLNTYPWCYRRSLVFATLAVCALGVSYLTLWGTDTRLNETLAIGYFGLWGATLGSYVFGAVWHDRGLMLARRRRPRVESAEATEDDPNEEEPSPS